MIVAYENRIVMQETLEAGLAELLTAAASSERFDLDRRPPPVRRLRAVPVHRSRARPSVPGRGAHYERRPRNEAATGPPTANCDKRTATERMRSR